MARVGRSEAGELLLAEEALAIVEPTPFWALSLPNAYRAGFLAHVLLERGKIGEAEAIVGRVAVEELTRPPNPNASRKRPRAAPDGTPDQALADFIAAGKAAESVDIRNPAYIPWRSQAALALPQLGRDDEARALAGEELELSRRWGAPRTVGISLRALGLVEGGQAGEPLLREAVEVLADRRPGSSTRGRCRSRRGAAARQQPQRGAEAVARRSRARPSVRRERCWSQARERGARGDRRAPAQDRAQRPRFADGERAAGRADGCRRA